MGQRYLEAWFKDVLKVLKQETLPHIKWVPGYIGNTIGADPKRFGREFAKFLLNGGVMDGASSRPDGLKPQNK